MPLNIPGQAGNAVPAPQKEPTAPVANKTKILIITVIILIAIIGIWQLVLIKKGGTSYQSSAKDNQKNSLTTEAQENSSYELTQNTAGQKQLTPEEKYVAAETISVSNGEHNLTVEEFGNVIKKVFGEYKITGYTQGYMGMNSGSGIAQYTLTKSISVEEADSLKQAAEQQGFVILAMDKQLKSINIKAQKNGYSYSLSYNDGDQEITVIIEKINQ